MFIYLRKLWILLFTKHPYKVMRFADLYTDPVGVQVDRPETISAILYQEKGSLIHYDQEPVSFNTPPVVRHIRQQNRFIYKGVFKEPDRCIYSITKGSIIGTSGFVFDHSNRTFIAESAKEWSINLKNSPYTNLIHYPVQTFLEGITISGLTNSADGGFYHFLFESFTKLAYLKVLLPAADHILLNGPKTNWKIKWLERAGYPVEKVIWHDHTRYFTCEQLLFTNTLVADQQLSNWCIDTLKTELNIEFSADRNDAQSIIWISRKGQQARDLQWEDEVFKLFPQIECINLSDLTVAETIEKLSKASHILGAHGAGFSNIFMARPGTKVLEIYPDGAVFQPCYQRLSTICKHKHHIMYLDFENKDNTTSGMTAFTDAFAKFI